MLLKVSRVTHRKEKINYVHQNKDNVGDLRLVIAVTAEEQATCDDMMREHLSVVFPALFNVDHHDLLQPECELDKDIELQTAADFPVWPVSPQHLHIEPIIRVVHHILNHH